MTILDRFSASVSRAYQALRGGATSRVPDGAIVLDPAAAWRWTTEYTPERLNQIKARRALAEVIQLCDDMLTDDRLRAVAFMRAQALTGAEVEFVTGEGRKKARALKAADPERDFWEMVPEAEWIQMIVWGLLANFGTGRKRWWERSRSGYVPRRRNGRVVPRLEFWHPRNFRLDPTGRQWIVKVETPDSMVAIDREMSFEDNEFLCFRPWGGDPGCVDRGLWIAACKLWLLKQHVIRSTGSIINMLAMPIRVVEYALGQQGVNVEHAGGADPKRKQLVDEIYAMARNGVVSLPPGFTMKLLAAPATSHQMLDAQLSVINDAFAILFLGNNLTTSIKGGSLAAANAGQEMLGFLRRFDAQQESTFLHDDVMVSWAEINFGDGEAAPWPARNVEPPEDLKAKAAMWLSVSQAVTGFEKANWLLDKKKTGEIYELPLIEGQPNTVLPAAPSPPGGPPPAAATPPAQGAANVA